MFIRIFMLWSVSLFTIACELQAIPLSLQHDGCSCTYYLPGKHVQGRQVVLQSRMGTDQAQMFRQGKLVSLGGSKEQLPMHTPAQWWQLKYHHASEAVFLNMQVASSCEWGTAGCNAVHYLGQLNIASNYQQCAWTLRGECGC